MELLQLIIKEPHTEGPGIEPPTHHLALVVVKSFKLVPTQGRGHKRVGGKAQEPEQGQDADADRVDDVHPNVSIQRIIDMHVVRAIDPPLGFGPRPSMSFFMYNQDGRQAVARPHFDGVPSGGPRGPSPLRDHLDMPKYHQQDAWDAETNAPSSNFVYDFDVYRYFVRDEWREVFAHGPDGVCRGGSLDTLVDAFSEGAELKVGVGGLCDDLGSTLGHEVFVHVGPGYYHTDRRIFCAGTQPLVRVKPGIPMQYETGASDFGWLMPRTDGRVSRWLCNPYTLTFAKSEARYPLRWLAR